MKNRTAVTAVTFFLLSTILSAGIASAETISVALQLLPGIKFPGPAPSMSGLKAPVLGGGINEMLKDRTIRPNRMYSSSQVDKSA